MTGFYANEWDARVDLAAAHRLAVMYGFHEGIDNHLTLMVPGYDDRFFLTPFGLHWSEVKASDFIVVDYDGTILEGDKVVVELSTANGSPVEEADDMEPDELSDSSVNGLMGNEGPDARMMRAAEKADQGGLA
mgnify:CR=1 FL=1